MKRRSLSLSALLLLSGCGGWALQEPAASAYLPPDAVVGAGDPLRAAVMQSSYVFANPRRFVDRPGDVARAVANQEYLTVAILSDPRVNVYNGNIPVLLQDGKNEARAFYGIAPTATAQEVIDSLYAVSRALRLGDRVAAERALSPAIFPNPAQTMARLSQAPALPLSNVATARTFEEMSQSRSVRPL